MTEEQQLKLQAFLDGELPEAGAREVLAWTQRDEAAAALLAELRNTRRAMSQAGPRWTVPETREFYWSKIEREIQRPEAQTSRAPGVSWFGILCRRVLPAGFVAALLVAGLLVYRLNAPPPAPTTVADADEPTVETTLANSDATTYRDASGDTTLVWFSYADAGPAQLKTPSAVN